MAFCIEWDHGLSLMLKIKSQDQILSFNVRADDGRVESESDTGICPRQQTMNCTNCGQKLKGMARFFFFFKNLNPATIARQRGEMP